MRVVGKTNVPHFMTFFDMSEIQSYGVLNNEKQRQKHSDITHFCIQLFASTSGS